jgi:hypothetical protein
MFNEIKCFFLSMPLLIFHESFSGHWKDDSVVPLSHKAALSTVTLS